MKNTRMIKVIALINFVLFSCTSEELGTLEEKNSSNTVNWKSQQIEMPRISENELIILFHSTFPDDAREDLRIKHEVIRHEKCNCITEKIEKWTFKEETNIEERMSDIAQEAEVEGVDFQYYYTNADVTPDINIEINGSTDLLASFINPLQKVINIGVIDTGINLDLIDKKDTFLYNVTTPPCIANEVKEISGWNFIKDNNNPFDDQGHGTAVVDRIIRQIDKKRGTKNRYSILPIKAFDRLGQGNTFKLLCGYLFAAEKSNMHIINMSFGWYGAPSELLDLFISENTNILHITSAGNHNSNNDELAHYPSSIPYGNVLTIGSYHMINSDLGSLKKSSFSNYGRENVDFLSEGERIVFTDRYGKAYPVFGTSYAAPFVTAEAASHAIWSNTPSPEYLWSQLENYSIYVPQGELPVYYKDRIIK